MICSTALDGAGDDVARGFFGGRLGFGFLVLDHDRETMVYVALDLVEQLILRFFGAEAGNTLQFQLLLVDQFAQLCACFFQFIFFFKKRVFFLFKIGRFAVQGIFLLHQTFFGVVRL